MTASEPSGPPPPHDPPGAPGAPGAASTSARASVPIARPEGPGRSAVGPIELFFDLVYVFAIIQLSHMLLYNLTWLGAARTAVVFAGVWWAWNYTAWAMNWLNPRHGGVRLLNMALMLAGLGMALALPRAFDDGAVVFVGCYVFAQLLRPSFMIVAFRGQQLGRNYQALLAWSALAAAFWIAGAFAPPSARLWIWLLAVVLDYLGPRVDFRFPFVGGAPMHLWDTDAHHLAERNQLVFLIALGESILLMGFTLAALPELTTAALTALGAGFAGLCLLWWSYFALAGNDTARGDDEAGGTGALRSAYAYAHAVMVAGAIVLAVSIELRLSGHGPHEAVVLTTVGGPLLFVIGNVVFLRTRTGSVARSRYAAGGALAVIAAIGLVAGEAVPVAALSVATLAVMAVLAGATQVLSAWRTPSRRPGQS